MPHLLQHHVGQDSRQPNGYSSGRSVANRSSAAYINRLPVELLLEIFQTCLPADFGYYMSLFRLPPFSLSLVCRLWRSIVYSSPFLWASFSLVHDAYERCRWLTPWAVRYWLSHAQGSPLTLKVVARSEAPADYVAGVFSLVLKAAPYWHDVDLMLTKDTCNQLLATDPRCAPRLSRLVLNANECTNQQAVMLASFVGYLRSLTRLSMEHYAQYPTPFTGIPFSRLTHLKIGTRILLNECIMAISRCTQIIELDLHVVVIPYSTPPTTIFREAVSATLQTFHIRTNTFLSSLFPYFRFPALRSLFINSNIRNTAQDVRSLAEFFNRSGCQLVGFTLLDRAMKEADLTSCLSHPALRRVQILDLSCAHASDSALRLLTLHEDGENVMPHLRSISLRSCAPSDNICAEMLHSRFYAPLSSTSCSVLQYAIVGFHLLPEQMSQSVGRDYCESVRECIQKHAGDITRFKAMAGEGRSLSWSFF